jgi:hypothetical protein
MAIYLQNEGRASGWNERKEKGQWERERKDELVIFKLCIH